MVPCCIWFFTTISFLYDMFFISISFLYDIIHHRLSHLCLLSYNMKTNNTSIIITFENKIMQII